ncbi:MAG: Ig-like domain-containing protein [Acidobacteria bacterium]|nr:Ig-like domain-containing protein [Acidobacteriota bacterium]
MRILYRTLVGVFVLSCLFTCGYNIFQSTEFTTTASTTGGKVARQSPTITSISPGQVPKGQVPAKIKIVGTGFVSGSRVFFTDQEVPAKVKASGRKIVLKGLAASLFALDRTYDVVVQTPTGQRSNIVKLVVGTGVNPAEPASIQVSQPQSLALNTTTSTQITARVLDKDGREISGAQITYQSDNIPVATVTSTGLVSGINEGAASIQLQSGAVTTRLMFRVSQVDSVSSGIFGQSDMANFAGTIYASDLSKHIIRRSQSFQPMNDYAGQSGIAGNIDSTLTASRFDAPLGVGFRNGMLYLADTNNQAVRQINTATGAVRTIVTRANAVAAGGVSSWGPRDVEIDVNNDLYITDAVNHVVWQATVQNSSVQLRVLAGQIGQPGIVDGQGTGARFNTPQRITLTGKILSVTQTGNQVRQIGLPGGAVKTIQSQSGRPSDRSDLARTNQSHPFEPIEFEDESPSWMEEASADFESRDPLQTAQPSAIASDVDGNLYVATPGNVQLITITNDQAIVSDLVAPGTLQNPVALTVSPDAVFALDGSTGQLVRIQFGKPTISQINPSQVGAGSSSNLITLTGDNFYFDTQVFLGSQAVSNVTVLSSKQLQFTLPPQPFGGSLILRVRNRGGEARGILTITGTPAPPMVKLGAFPTSRTVAQGESAFFTIELDRTNFEENVNLAVTGLPTGATALFSANPTTASAVQFKVDVTTRVTAGNYTLQVTGTGTGVTVTPTQLTLSVTSVSNVVLGANPTTRTVAVGQDANYTLSLTRTNFTGSVTLATTSLPSGVTSSFNPGSVTGTSSTLTVTVSTSAASGTFKFNVTGTASGTTVVPVELTLTITGAQPQVLLSVSPDTRQVTAGGSADYTVTLTRTNFTGAVDMTVRGIGGPTPRVGLDAAFTPDNTTGNTSTLNIRTNIGGTTLPGTYTFRVTGTASGATVVDSNVFSLVVISNNPPSVVVSVDPLSQQVIAGGIAQYRLTVTKTNYSGSVLLSLIGNVPPQTTVSFNPPQFDVSTTMIFDTSSDTPHGNYVMQIVAEADGVVIQPVTFSLQVEEQSPPTITLSMNPTSRTIMSGETASYTVTVTTSNFSGSVNLSVTGNIPPATSFSFNPPQFTSTTTLIFTTSGNTPSGTYNMQLVATSNPSVSITPVSFSLIIQNVGLRKTARLVQTSPVEGKLDSKEIRFDQPPIFSELVQPVTFPIQENFSSNMIFELPDVSGLEKLRMCDLGSQVRRSEGTLTPINPIN